MATSIDSLMTLKELNDAIGKFRDGSNTNYHIYGATIADHFTCPDEITRDRLAAMGFNCHKGETYDDWQHGVLMLMLVETPDGWITRCGHEMEMANPQPETIGDRRRLLERILRSHSPLEPTAKQLR